MPSPQQQKRIRSAVHAAVCTLGGTDGLGKCGLYAAAGQALLAYSGVQTWTQIGECSVQVSHE